MSAGGRRAMIIILAAGFLVSLCLNLFIAGAWVAGRWLDRSLAPLASAAMEPYPPSVRRAVRQKLVAERAELLSAAVELRDARLRMFAAMRTDPLDRGALDRAMADVRARTTAVQALLQSALAEVLAQTPAAERQKIESPRSGPGWFSQRRP